MNMECMKYETEQKRIIFYGKQQHCSNFEHMTARENFVYTMSAEGCITQINLYNLISHPSLNRATNRPIVNKTLLLMSVSE